jgi:hypothetical protein
MKLRRFTGLAALAAFVSIAAASEGQAGGGTAIASCGQVVTQDAFLATSLSCAGSDGVVVGADGITIDLKGFTLRGNRTSGRHGINDSGFSRLTVKNGVVRNFDIGVAAYNGADQTSISGLLASGNASDGIFVAGASATIKSSTSSGNAGSGIDVGGVGVKIQSSAAVGNGIVGIQVNGDSTSVTSSIASGNRSLGIEVVGDFAVIRSTTASGNVVEGILVSGSAARIQSSTASGNGSIGIEVDGGFGAAQVKSNRAEANGFAGGASDGGGLGIGVLGSVTGTNVARGNDDGSECSPLSLC